MTTPILDDLARALWKIYRRPDRPEPWIRDGNLPWNDPAFSERMLREHLDQSHSAASRVAAERQLQLDWFWKNLALLPGANLLDMTCGPGLYAVDFAKRGVQVTGIDFSPASIAYAQNLAEQEDVADHCHFIEQDVRQAVLPEQAFEAATFIYGQLAVFPPAQAQALLSKIYSTLKPGGRLVLELLNQDRVDKKHSTWWYTGETGLWGDAPFLHLGERFWDEESQRSTERFQILHLETGRLDEIILSDQTYAVETMRGMLAQAGFSQVEAFENWAGLPLYDAAEWLVYLAKT